MNYNELKLAIYECDIDNMTEGYISDEVNKVTSSINALNEWQNNELKKLDDWRNTQEEKLAQQLASNNDFDEYEKCDKQLRDEYFKRRKNITDEWELKMRKLKNSNVRESVNDIKLSIYEAYDNGDINESEKYDLLNSLENSICESTAAQRNEKKRRDEIRELRAEYHKKIAALKYKTTTLEKRRSAAESDEERRAIDEKIEKIRSEISDIKKDKDAKIHDMKDLINKNYMKDTNGERHHNSDSVSTSCQIGHFIAHKYKHMNDDIRDSSIKYGRRYKDAIRDSKFYSKGTDPNDKKPNKYLNVQKALKESVNDIKLSIYESYDNGLITEAEKYTLLELLDD